MATASISAQIADLLGEDPARPRPKRVSVAQALATCPRGAVLAATNETGEDVVVAITDAGKTYVVADTCPHDGGALSTGFVEGDRLVCARHGWEFDLDSGLCPFRQACVDSKKVR